MLIVYLNLENLYKQPTFVTNSLHLTDTQMQRIPLKEVYNERVKPSQYTSTSSKHNREPSTTTTYTTCNRTMPYPDPNPCHDMSGNIGWNVGFARPPVKPLIGPVGWNLDGDAIAPPARPNPPYPLFDTYPASAPAYKDTPYLLTKHD